MQTIYKTEYRERRQRNKVILVTYYRGSIEDDDFWIFIVVRWTEHKVIYDVWKNQLKKCVEVRCKWELNGEQLYLV